MSPASREEDAPQEATEPEASSDAAAEVTSDTEPEASSDTEPEAAEAAAEEAAPAEAGKKSSTAKAEKAPAAKAEKAPAAKAEGGKAEAAKAAGGKAPARSRTSAAKATASKPKAKAAPASTEVKVDLPADIFDSTVNIPLIHQVVVAQQAAARQGTHATKTRGQVRGGGKKPYRQKGTGRARQGSIRAPQFAGGGTVHGPVPRSYEQRTPKKMKAAALRGALSDRARHGLVQVVDAFTGGDQPKTKDALAMLGVVTGAVPGSRSVLVVAERSDQATWKSLRNAVGVHLIDPGQLNTYDVLVNERVVFTSGAYASFVARVGSSSEQEG